MKNVFEELEAEVAQCAVDRKHDAIDRKNLLIANDNLIVECLSKEVFSVATKSKLNVARFTEMHVVNTSIEARCLALEAELATLHDKIDEFEKGLVENPKIMDESEDRMEKEGDEQPFLERSPNSIQVALSYDTETDTQEKDKNKAKNDKTEHRMEKIGKDKVIRSRKSKLENITRADFAFDPKFNSKDQFCQKRKVVPGKD
nr:hypothetical protein [Tanacetum cinerariifolium]